MTSFVRKYAFKLCVIRSVIIFVLHSIDRICLMDYETYKSATQDIKCTRRNYVDERAFVHYAMAVGC